LNWRARVLVYICDRGLGGSEIITGKNNGKTMIKQWLSNVLQLGALPFEVDDGIYQDGLLLQ
tara:strand:+ start:61 stop:246 length:186 start_codon:yes stop_codon:yes gene_type:complete